MQLIAEAYDVLRRGLGLSTPEAAGGVRRVEPRPARVVPRRDHRAGLPRQRPRDRAAAGGRDPGQGGPEGHRQVDGAGRAGPGGPDPDDRRRARRARAVQPEGRSASPPAAILPATDTRAPFAGSIATAGQDALRDALLRRAGVQLRAGHGAHRRADPPSTTGRSTSRRWRASGRAAASSARGCSIRCGRRSRRKPALANLLVDPAIARDTAAGGPRLAPHRGGRGRRAGSPCRRSARASRTSTAIARRGCRRTSRRPSATPSARTSSNAVETAGVRARRLGCEDLSHGG